MIFLTKRVAASGTVGLVQTAVNMGKTSTTQSTNFEIGINWTPTGGAGSLTFLEISCETGSTGANMAGTIVTWGDAGRTAGTGTSLALVANTSTGANARVLIFAGFCDVSQLTPPLTTGRFQIDWNGVSVVSSTRAAYEASGVDTDTGNIVAAEAKTASGTTLNPTLDAPEGALLLACLSIESGDYSGEITVGGSETLDRVDATGTNATSDNTGAWSHRFPVSAGSVGMTFTWTTAAREAAAQLIAVPPAP